jgi:hypothetical protein
MIPPSTTLTPEGRKIRTRLLLAAALIVLVNLAVFLGGKLTAGQRVAGPDGSTYVTTAFGTAALAELLEGEGLIVSRLRAPFTASRLQPAQTLLLVDIGFAGFAASELTSVNGFLEEGGRLVLAGAVPDDLLEVLGGDLPEWESAGPTMAFATGDLAGVGEVPLSGAGSFSRTGRTTAVLSADDGTPVSVTWSLGAGSITWLADPTPLMNVGLARGDSAGLAVALVQGRPAVFDEYRHGFGGESFWQALPDGWTATLLLLAVAGLAALIAYARRLGPPEMVERQLRPDRATYIESVAAILGRTRRLNESIGPVRARARRLLASRAGLTQAAPDDALRRAGEAANLTTEQIDAVLDESGDALTTGRALARLSQDPR